MKSARPDAGASTRPSFFRIPAIEALLIQSLSFALVLGVAWVMPLLGAVQLSIGVAAVLQGCIAAVLARWRRMASWWLPIQLLFPVAVLLLHAVGLPSWFFLVAFLVLLVLFWSTFRTQVPFYPSNAATWDAVAGLLPPGRTLRFIDIGSGFGGLVMNLAARRPESAFTGIELAPLPWVVSSLRALMRRLPRGRVEFMRGDYDCLQFAAFDVVFAYLSPAAMPALWQKARTEMRSGTLLLSYEFAIPDAPPQIVLQPEQDGPFLYGWAM